MRILIAVDGSPISTRAVKFAAALARRLALASQVFLLYVDPPLMRAVAMEMGLEGTRDYHAGNGKYAMRAARQALHRAQIEFDERVLVGEPAATIVKHASNNKCDLIVMGSHGRGALKGLLMGSVVSKVIAQCTIPVTVVR